MATQLRARVVDILDMDVPARSAIACHITMRLSDGRVLAPTVAAKRIGARVVLGIGRRFGLLAFSFADDHLHALAACNREQGGQLAQTTEHSLRARLELPAAFEPARFTIVADQRHLQSALPYVCRQVLRHGLIDPLHDGSVLPDLLGLRALDGGCLARVQALLPRLTAAEVRSWVHPDLHRELPLSFDALADAAAGALALPDLLTDTPDAVRARRAAVHVASSLPVARVADHLRITTRSVRRLRSQPSEPSVMCAVVLQLRLRALIGNARETTVQAAPFPASKPWGAHQGNGAPLRPPSRTQMEP